MQTLLRVGIVGCGGIAQVHMQSIESLEGAKLVACADVKIERAEQMAEATGAKAYASLQNMLQGEELDVLHICTPHYLHTDMIEAGVKAGLAVFSEKPPVTTREQLERLKALPKEAKVGICFQNRWNPATRYVEELLKSGELGKVHGIRGMVTWARGAAYYTESGWRGQLSTEGGGALINQSIHSLDLMLVFMGKATEVGANMANHHLAGVIEVEDTLTAHLKFGKATGLLYATTAYAIDAPVIIDLHGENGAVRIEGPNVSRCGSDGIWVHQMREDAQLVQKEKSYWGNGHLACIEAFYESVTSGTEFESSIRNVMPTIECMLEIYESARSK